MKLLREDSIQHNLTRIIILIAGIALLFALLIISSYNILSYYHSLTRNLIVQARIVSNNSTAAILFNNRIDAEETLSALKTVPNITSAIIYTKEGKVFATYQREKSKEDIHQFISHKEGYRLGINHLSLLHPIVIDKETIGNIYIRSDLKDLYTYLLLHLSLIIIVVTISLFIAIQLFSRLQSTITTPISNLAGLMRTVSEDKDYSVRSLIHGPSELRYLSNGFNEMLEQIQKRDSELELHRQHLEDLVNIRTAEMTKINEQLEQQLLERMRSEDKIRYMAYYDVLTDLPNRVFFKELLSRAIIHARRYGRIFAVFFIDLDHFKRINDTLGHDTGDILLKAVTKRLLQSLRSSDLIARSDSDMEKIEETISRMGGDEFIILLPELKAVEDAGRVAIRIIRDFSKPFVLNDSREIFITCSIGISIYPYDGEDVDSILKTADIAMYHAKEQGRNNYQFYKESLNADALERLNIENEMRRALNNKEFMLYYQPKINILNRKIVGIEALIRWRHPKKGMISPAQFIPLAEETGLIIPIGEWVIRTACLQNKDWQQAGFRPISVAVNLSARQIEQEDLIETVSQALSYAQIHPQYLELEITESTVMKNPVKATATLKALKDMGIKISLDDFGTGYSSLNYLRQLPLDSLKIDRSFIKDTTTSLDNAAVIKAIIALAHNLQLNVIAEGVETEEQMAFLSEHECDEMQGYLLSPPLPSEDITQFLPKANA
ncbi:MAG: EAL domain-containing protein [Nitrospirota bacterium]